jgi:hypothetical protein
MTVIYEYQCKIAFKKANDHRILCELRPSITLRYQSYSRQGRSVTPFQYNISYLRRANSTHQMRILWTYYRSKLLSLLYLLSPHLSLISHDNGDDFPRQHTTGTDVQISNRLICTCFYLLPIPREAEHMPSHLPLSLQQILWLSVQ